MEPRHFSLVVYHRNGVQVVPLEAGQAVVIGRSAPADCIVAESERRFFSQLARELGASEAEADRALDDFLETPPADDAIDPTRVRPALADTVRRTALRAIAADGHVARSEMKMFELLDDLLPRAPS